ncbi:uncharacterized protein OCT59_013916 [Rhizophagus irregularis]|uniref:Uncharacterized protein n=4 Tax=Rhizophagus irregularis TaxID=588596 RepID=A0A2I1FE61_9GLOM|nr:hypothetical protein RhiirC2_758080 [Rhizophagus irregularis]GBC23184.1 hypothetical protein GLOIN_2v1564661 [Rhizophagus irregularis DAOM 181602=DAOM 197198]PKY32648.1 hypothetical protein RhiirB3_420246 [Rhizophagus irregularis]UZO21526.1 hypothetical protein OCT59_013916 [Rhizophagus irregularis]CAB4391097.1 unnamed protein product [Rhizophagus irregularis]
MGEVNVPIITLTLSTPAQQKLDGLLEQNSEFDSSDTRSIASNPPEYTSNNNNTQQENTSTTNNSSLAYPTQAHISQTSASTDLPTYDHAKIDMPPIYQTPIITPEAHIDNVPLDTQAPWPITKKLYFFGFLFWPLWFIGMGFSIFGRSEKTRMWGRRCASNSLIIIIVFVYLLVAYIRTRGRLT